MDLQGRIDPTEHPLSPPTPKQQQKQSSRNAMRFTGMDLRTELYRILGVDLTEVPGLGTLSIHTLLAEIGPDLSAFPTYKHFCSWLGLCPDNRISGGKVLSVRTRKVRSRVATALHMAAQSLWHSETPLGGYFRRMRTKLGAPKAITAAAHQLARIIYHMVKTGEAYDESVLARAQDKLRRNVEAKLRAHAKRLGFDLVAIPEPA